jgi:5'-nucleotidase
MLPVRGVGLSLAAAVLAGCGDGGDGDGERRAAPPAEVLDVVVTNDDGYDAPGIDVLVEALRSQPDTEMTVVAPAGEASGTGGRTTPGELVTRAVETDSGFEATAVRGYPADAVAVALDDLDLDPDLVVSGINTTQNLGALVDVSGTVGAARAAAAGGVPALAVSAGRADRPDYDRAAEEALAWVADHREELTSGDAEPVVANLNVPTCTEGEVRGLVEVPAARHAEDALLAASEVRCDSSLAEPADDIEGFNNGFATLSSV